MVTQFDVDQQRQTMRQAALGNIMGGIQGLDQQAKTKRAQALEDEKTALEYRKAGYEVTPEMVSQIRAEEPSGFAKFFGAESPERPDLFANRTEEWKAKQEAEKQDRIYKREGENLNRQFKRAQIANMGAEGKKKFAEAEKIQKESTLGKKLSPTEISKFNEGNAIPMMLDDLEGTINNNLDMFGPIAGRINSYNPWDERTKTAESQLTAAAQTVGKYLEGGVLRAEDIPKYRKMLPDLTDTPEVAQNKLANVRRLLINKQNSDVDALRQGGYDVSSIDKGFVAPNSPSILAGNKSKGLENTAIAQDPEAMRQQLRSMSRAEKIRLLQGN